MQNQTEKRILELKKEKNAVILAHYYAPNEVQRLADYVGDSFYLAKIAKKSNTKVLYDAGGLYDGRATG